VQLPPPKKKCSSSNLQLRQLSTLTAPGSSNSQFQWSLISIFKLLSGWSNSKLLKCLRFSTAASGTLLQLRTFHCSSSAGLCLSSAAPCLGRLCPKNSPITGLGSSLSRQLLISAAPYLLFLRHSSPTISPPIWSDYITSVHLLPPSAGCSDAEVGAGFGAEVGASFGGAVFGVGLGGYLTSVSVVTSALFRFRCGRLRCLCRKTHTVELVHRAFYRSGYLLGFGDFYICFYDLTLTGIFGCCFYDLLRLYLTDIWLLLL
jgi:hypothetical protein